MKKSIALAMFAALALVPSTASAAVGDKVTGGGQVIASAAKGPGDTIAFNAQQTGDAVKGQVQFIDRTDGKQTFKFHGFVTCVEASETDGTFQIGGFQRGEDPESDDAVTFNILGKDNGNNAGDADLVEFNTEGAGCEEEDDAAEDLTLTRGNVKVHGYSASSSRGSFSFASALRLARFGR